MCWLGITLSPDVQLSRSPFVVWICENSVGKIGFSGSFNSVWNDDYIRHTCRYLSLFLANNKFADPPHTVSPHPWKRVRELNYLEVPVCLASQISQSRYKESSPKATLRVNARLTLVRQFYLLTPGGKEVEHNGLSDRDPFKDNPYTCLGWLNWQ